MFKGLWTMRGQEISNNSTSGFLPIGIYSTGGVSAGRIIPRWTHDGCVETRCPYCDTRTAKKINLKEGETSKCPSCGGEL